jgi:hypothetical protein
MVNDLEKFCTPDATPSPALHHANLATNRGKSCNQ